jgi:hypothetical protein
MGESAGMKDKSWLIGVLSTQLAIDRLIRHHG